MLPLDLSNKVALVTGASRGIGRATALALARAGAHVGVNYLHATEAADGLVEELRRLGVSGLALRADVSREEDVAALFAALERGLGPPDLLVANAGIWSEAAIECMSSRSWRETLDTNLDSVFLCAREAARSMLERRSGAMVLVSSTAGQRGEARHAHYAASKGAIISFTKSLAAELGPRGIRVNCVAPGWVETDMCTEALASEQRRRAVTSQIPLGRIALAEDIAGPILFLASPLARHINGEILNVNGGSVLCG